MEVWGRARYGVASIHDTPRVKYVKYGVASIQCLHLVKKSASFVEEIWLDQADPIFNGTVRNACSTKRWYTHVVTEVTSRSRGNTG